MKEPGAGFIVPNSPTEFAPRGHFGLLGVHERADLIGTRPAMEATPGKGTRLRVVLSLVEDRHPSFCAE